VRESSLDGFWPLGGIPDHNQRTFEHRALFLDPPGVGNDQRRVPGQAKQGAVINRRYRAQAVKRSSEAAALGGQAGARVDGQQHRQAELAEFVEYCAQPLRVVGVLRAVDRGKHITAWLGTEGGRDIPRRGVVGEVVLRCLHNRVAR